MIIYCDLDGVLADFDKHHEDLLGVKPCRVADNVDWAKVRALGDFFLTMPMKPDALNLWDYISPRKPIILTGVPDNVDAANNDKRSWVKRHLGKHVPVICCKSKNKALYCKPGDILIDDWTKYQDKWVAAGGLWVTHKNTVDTIRQLRVLGVC